MQAHINNILAVYNHATQDQKETGKSAYKSYHKELKKLAEFHEIEFNKVVAAFACLSPGVNIDKNFKACCDLCEFIKKEKDPSRLKEIRYTGYGAALNRAYDILLGFLDFETSLNRKTQKTLCFYINILKPEKDERVTIDRHAISVCYGRETTEQERKRIFDTKRQYLIIEDAYKQAAKKVGLKALELQAIVWYAWREKH